MRFWYIWGEISRVMAVLCLITALAALAAAGILLVREKLACRVMDEMRSPAGKRRGLLALAAAVVWILVIGKSVSAAEISGGASTSEAAGTGHTAPNTEIAAEEEPEQEPDETAPLVVIEMTGEAKECGGNIYCRSGNAGLRVVMEERDDLDSGLAVCSVSVTDSEGETVTREWECSHTQTEEVDFYTEEIEALADGPVEVSAVATDSAGNSTRESLQFVLDTKAPVLTQILTYADGEDASVGERPVYDGSDLYYNSGELTTHIVIEDMSPVKWQISYLKQPGEGVLRSGEGCEGSVTISEEGVYSDWAIAGEDAAGNALCLSEDCVCSQDAENPQESDGKISLPARKILDRTPPEGEIRYSCPATGYAYSAKSGEEIYWSGDVKVTLSITERCAGQEMPADPEDYVLLRRQDGETESIEERAYEITQDGRMRFDAFGHDRAGNGLRVRRVFATGIKAVTDELPSEETGGPQSGAESCRFRTEAIRDTACPLLTAQISRPSGNPAAADKEKAIVYYGDSREQYGGGDPVLSVCFTVSDSNLDEERIEPRIAYAGVKDGNSCEETAPVWKKAASGEWEKKRLQEKAEDAGSATERLQFTRREHPGGDDTPDGVYRFGIAGTDKAGNPLLLAAAGSDDGRSLSDAERKKAEDEVFGVICESAPKGAFVTGKKVVDTQAPSGEICVMNPEGDVYCRLTSHSREWSLDRSSLMPYRRENAARIVCNAEDSSPSAVCCRVLSTAGARNDPGLYGSEYSFGCREELQIRGEQIFRIENAVLRDRAGNESAVLVKTVNFYLDTGLPEVDIDAPAVSVRALPEITQQSADGRPLYNGSLRLEVSAEDRDSRHGASGLSEVRYQVEVDGKTMMSGYRDLGADPEQGSDPVYTFSGMIDIPAGGIWESNDIEVLVTAKDNAGNCSDPGKGGVFRFGIDTTPPSVTVRFDNNEVINGRYFARERTAQIIVQERNPDFAALQVLAPGAVIGEWKHSGNSALGDADEWIMEVQFAADGEYTLEVSGTDALGNPAAVKYTGEAAQAFTIDRTPPLVEVLWDNADVRNGIYYNRERKATIRITDQSFDGRGVTILPYPRGFREVSRLRDSRYAGVISVYEAEVPFTEEGEWSLSCICRDLAGNCAPPIAAEPFVIDMTGPELYFDPETVLERGAYGGCIEPVLLCRDDHLCADTCCAKWINITAGGCVTACRKGSVSDSNCEVVLPDPPKENNYDGVCVLEGAACDLAGNRAFVRRNLSVNRFGSVYDISEDETTFRMCGGSYTDAVSPLVIAEYNVSPLVSRQITIFRNGAAQVLAEGADYTVSEERKPAGVKYVYRIDPAVYAKDGRYTILLESEDEAGGHSSSPGRFGRGPDFSPEWAVDRTPPSVRITGVDTEKHRFISDALPVRLVPSDNMELQELRIRITDDRGSIIKEENISGTELEKIMELNHGEVPVLISAGERWQTLEANAVDGAGNCSEELLGLKDDGEKGYSVLVSADPIVHFYRSGLLPAAAFLAMIAAFHYAYSVYKRTLA